MADLKSEPCCERFESCEVDCIPRLHWHDARRIRSETRTIPPGRRRVVCAAVRSADGFLVLGIRHYSQDMHQQIAQREDGHKFAHRHDEDQGFVDQHGVFMSREEAYRVAEAAGQIVRPEACGEGLHGPKLYSEGLY